MLRKGSRKVEEEIEAVADSRYEFIFLRIGGQAETHFEIKLGGRSSDKTKGRQKDRQLHPRFLIVGQNMITE
jgi:hypothetical protein